MGNFRAFRTKKSFYSWCLIIGSIVTVSLFIISKDPSLGNDSYSYINMSVIRPAGYPLFLYIMRIFGEAYLSYVVFVQTGINAAVLLYFLFYVGKNFKINEVHLLLLLPLLLYYLVFIISPEKILTESIAFPLFLLEAIYLIESILKKEYKSIYIALAINTFLVLVRGQFLFMYPIILFLGLYIFFRKKKLFDYSKISKLISILILSILSVWLINKIYHYVLHDSFSDTQMNMSFIVNAMYVSEKDDYLIFENEETQKIHRIVYDSLFSGGFNKDAFHKIIQPKIDVSRKSDLIRHYHENLTNIGSTLRSDLIRSRYTHLSEIDYLLVRDEILKEMAWPIIKKNMHDYLYINLSDIFVYGYNNSRFYLLMVILLYSLTLLGFIKANIYGEVLFFFLTAQFISLFLMSLSNRVLPRYTFYFDFIIYSFLVISLMKILLDKRRNSDISNPSFH